MAFDLFSVLYSAAAVVVAVVVITLISICIHLAYFHPLAKHPGPFLAKFTNLYAGWHAWKGDIHVDMWRCHEKYGSFVRYQPNRLLVNTNTGLQDIYAHGKNVQKSTGYMAMVHRAPNTLTLIDKKAHGKRRRIISQGFGDSSLRKYQPTILERVQGLSAAIDRHCQDGKWSLPMNMADYFSYMSFDIMSNTIFGEDYDLLGTEKRRHVVKDIDESNVRTSVLVQAPEVLSFRLDKRLFPAAIQGRNRFLGFLAELLKGRYARPKSDRYDVFTFLLGAKDPDTGEGLKGAEIGAESATLIIAGSDTSSTALCAVFFYLAHNLSAYKRAADEVQNAFASANDITLGPRLTSCVYLRACIDEAMRMSPPTGGALWREVARGGGTINGVPIAEGCDVGVGIYAIHHNPGLYPSPFAFRPERWLDLECEAAGLGSVALAQSGYTPFSLGPRSCIGKGFALVELMLACATLLWKFDVQVADGDGAQHMGRVAQNNKDPEFRLRDHITGSKDGPVLQFRKRQLA